MTNCDRSLATKVKVHDTYKECPSSSKLKDILNSYDCPGSYRGDCEGWNVDHFKETPELKKKKTKCAKVQTCRGSGNSFQHDKSRW